MLIKELYRHQRPLAIAITIWLIAFLVINVKWGMVSTPVYQYGMFSSQQYLKDTVTTYNIKVNKEALPLTSLSFAERDVLFLTLDRYLLSDQHNNKVMQNMHRFVTAKPGDERYFLSLNDDQFFQWYHQIINRLWHKEIHSFTIHKEYFLWQDNQLQIVKSELIHSNE
jgi:hypothetical protein